LGLVADNLQRIREQIAETARRCGRSAWDIGLVAVTKTFPPAIIEEAIAAGQRAFGENRVQEAEAKIGALTRPAGIEWHLIGHLQTNKAKLAAELFDIVHSVDSEKVARKLSEAATAMGKTLPVLVQVDLGEEETKFGAARGSVALLVEAVSNLPGLNLDGLMTLPPFFDDPEQARPFFRELRQTRDRLTAERPGCLGRGHLSMGMSHDFEVAIEEGATLVRIGTAIFGDRSGA
jgi:PLP dependent protein